MLAPVSDNQLAGIFGGIADGSGGAAAKHIAEAVGHLDLAVRAQQAAILLGLAIQHDGVVGGVLVHGDGDGRTVFLQVFADFHAFIVGIDRGAAAEGGPVPATDARPGALSILRPFALYENSWLLLRDGDAGQQD